MNVVSIWKGTFSVFCRFLSDEVETIFWEHQANRSRLFKSKFGHRKLLRKWFWSYLDLKDEFRRVPSVWKGHFSFSWKFLSDEVETIFWESEEKRSKLFKSKLGHRKLLRKWFWRYLACKNDCCERLKRAFFSSFQIFKWRSWIPFLGNWRKTFKTI